jgi:uncharacterized GH25 family protein
VLRTFLALAVAVFGGGVVSAHETWLMPSAFEAKVGETVRINLTSGMGFPGLESAIGADRVQEAACRLGGVKEKTGSVKAADTSLALTQTFPRAGLAAVWVDLKPRPIELSDDQVAEYLHEIGATQELRSAWAARKGRVGWKETYTKHAKTFVTVGKVEGDRSWQTPVGMGLEIVPLDDPSSLRVGKEIRVRLLGHGKPVAGLPVGLLIEGSDKRLFRTTDAKGRVTFPAERTGAAMLFAVHLRPGEDEASWVSDFTTLTVRIHQMP